MKGYELVCYFVLLGFVAGVKINQCAQGGLLPQEIQVADCESDDNLCFVKFHGIVNMTMKFTAPRYLESIRPHLMGKTVFGNFNLTLLSDKLDACLGVTNSVCPLVLDEEIEYNYSIKLNVLPLLPITFEFSIIDMEENEAVVCFNMDVFPLIL